MKDQKQIYKPAEQDVASCYVSQEADCDANFVTSHQKIPFLD